MGKPGDPLTIHLLHYSSQFTDVTNATEEDLRFVFDKGADIITFTEMGNYGNQRASYKAMLRIARNNDYRPVVGPGDTQIAVKVGNGVWVKNSGTVPVHPARTGRYARKYISWVHVRFHGEDVFHHVAHWVTTPTSTGIDMQRHIKMSKTVARQVAKHAKDDNISFFAGDMNMGPAKDKYPHQIFRSKHLQTCWRDAGHRPATRTSGSTIDVIGRYKLDARVSFKRYKAWPFQNSDHRPFSVWYQITQSKAKGGGQKGKKKTPKQEKKPDMFDTGGDVSFADYTDKEIYLLPYAVDDTDLFNG